YRTHHAPNEISPLSLHDALPILFCKHAIAARLASEQGETKGVARRVDNLVAVFAALCIFFHRFALGAVVINHERQRALQAFQTRDRKSTRLNSSHVAISYAVFCL